MGAAFYHVWRRSVLYPGWLSSSRNCGRAASLGTVWQPGTLVGEAGPVYYRDLYRHTFRYSFGVNGPLECAVSLCRPFRADDIYRSELAALQIVHENNLCC